MRGGVGKFYEPHAGDRAGRISSQSAVIAPSFIFQTDEDLSGLSGRIPADSLPAADRQQRPGAVISPACRANLSDIRSRVAAGDFINTEPVVDGDRGWATSGRSAPASSTS